MSDENEVKQDELEALKQRADLMGVKYHPNTGVEKLKAKIENALNGEKQPEPEAAKPAGTSLASKKKQQREECLALKRIRLTCMDPNKRAWKGELFTISNNLVGTVKRYVPFDTEDGWHVPKIIYDHIKTAKCQIFVKEKIKGVDVPKGKLINTYAVEDLPPLTEKQIKELARKQAMARVED